MLLTLVGSICSGKSTAARSCTSLNGLTVHDFDEVSVPTDADVAWRQRNLEDWIQRALGYQDQGLDMLLTGQSPLGEVLATPSAPLLDGIAACLLDVEDDERLRRIENRDRGKWDQDAQRAFVGWGRWHREHATDPGSRQEVITTGGWDQMRWERWAAWTKQDARWHTTIVDTTGRAIDETAADVQRWIAATRADLTSGRLPLAREWA